MILIRNQLEITVIVPSFLKKRPDLLWNLRARPQSFNISHLLIFSHLVTFETFEYFLFNCHYFSYKIFLILLDEQVKFLWNPCRLQNENSNVI